MFRACSQIWHWREYTLAQDEGVMTRMAGHATPRTASPTFSGTRGAPLHAPHSTDASWNGGVHTNKATESRGPREEGHLARYLIAAPFITLALGPAGTRRLHGSFERKRIGDPESLMSSRPGPETTATPPGTAFLMPLSSAISPRYSIHRFAPTL
jgi:hypothetical protein